MNLLGIAAGLLSAVLQSCGYVASALFLKRHDGNAREMLAYTQFVQGLVSVPLFFALVPAEALTDARIWLANLYWLSIFTITQFSMFYTQKTVEPSKIATWLGLKIAVLAVLTAIWPLNGESVCAWQWLAIAITISAAFVLNASGGMRIGRKGALSLIVFILVASLCDRQQVVIMREFQDHGATMLKSALLTLSLGYWTFGLAALGYIISKVVRGEPFALAAVKLRDSSPFAFFWFTAMISIYFCYGELGPVFGNVVQSTRAVISVGIAFLACKLLKAGVEQSVGLSLWLRRLAAAILMTGGIILYSLFR